MNKLDQLLNIQEKRGFVMLVFSLLILTIFALSGVVVYLYFDNSRQRAQSEARERECLEQKNYLHQHYGQQLVSFFERQRDIQEQIQRLPKKKRRK